MTTTPYSSEYFQLVDAQSDSSAEVVVPILCELLAPTAVVDVGCGSGIWLKHFLLEGILDVLGIDGPWIDRELLSIPESCFEVVDLSQPPKPRRGFDLVLSLEVAEHLPPKAAEPFVNFLVGLGPAVAFSAAIPSQGGSGHLNEQWPGYWSRLFSNRGYVPFDVIRPEIWADERVAWWFRQNLTLYVDEKRTVQYERLGVPSKEVLPLVHPELYCRYIPQEPPRKHPGNPPSRGRLLTLLESLAKGLKIAHLDGVRRTPKRSLHSGSLMCPINRHSLDPSQSARVRVPPRQQDSRSQLTAKPDQDRVDGTSRRASADPWRQSCGDDRGADQPSDIRRLAVAKGPRSSGGAVRHIGYRGWL